MLVGLISDTHGLLRPEALSALADADLIIHAGDVGNSDIILALQRIAPTHAVRGNVDLGQWAVALPETLDLEASACRFHVIHRIADFQPGIASSGISAVIYGHSHQPSIESRDGILFCNPGSAGPRRFKLPVTVGRMRIEDGMLVPEIIVIA